MILISKFKIPPTLWNDAVERYYHIVDRIKQEWVVKSAAVLQPFIDKSDLKWFFLVKISSLVCEDILITGLARKMQIEPYLICDDNFKSLENEGVSRRCIYLWIDPKHCNEVVCKLKLQIGRKTSPI